MTKRDAICEAALDLFAEKGIEATTTREIAEKAGAAEGTLYRHFDGKEDLAQWLYRQCAAQLEDTLADATSNASTPPDHLEALVRGIFEFYASKPASCTYLLSARGSELGNRGTDSTLSPPLHFLTDTLEAGMDDGSFRDAPATLMAGWILAMVQQTVRSLKADALSISTQAAIDRTVDVALRLAEAPLP